MSTISGIGGAVDGASTVRAWSISSKADLQEFAASNTQGASGALPGNTDWSGQYSSYLPQPAVMPGEEFAFVGSIDGTKGASGTAIVDSVEITINIEGGNIISHTVNFSAAGTLTLGAAVAVDETIPGATTSIGCKVQIGPVGGAVADLPDVRTVTITITAANAAYVNSSTAGKTLRKRGNWNATVAISVHTADFSTLPQPNDVKIVHVYVNATDYYEFNWLIFGEATDLSVDREQATIVGGTLNAKFCIEQGGALGVLTLPDETQFWPEEVGT